MNFSNILCCALVLSLCVFLIPTTTHAELLAYENFDYEPTTDLTLEGREGGSGWLGPWRAGDHLTLQIADQPGYLTQTSGNPLYTGLIAQYSDQASSSRPLAIKLPLSIQSKLTTGSVAPRYYLSFLAKAQAGARFRVELMNEAREVRWAVERMPDGSVRAQAGTRSDITPQSLCKDGEIYLIVSCFDRLAQSVSVVAFDERQIRLGVTEPANWPLRVYGSSGVVLSLLDLRVTTSDVWFDELRIATTFAESLPQK